MKHLYFAVIVSASVLLSCSTPANHDTRKVSSLDNNGEIQDDSFDKNLETYYGGSAATENDANNAVAKVIKDFIQAQQQIRQETMTSPGSTKAESQRVFKDLPKPDYATRDVHRKTNGCFKAELNFSGDLKDKLNSQIAEYGKGLSNSPLTPIANENDIGVFAGGASYDAIVRLSNGHPGNRPDKLPDARGFAVKILPKGTLERGSIETLSAEELNAATKLDILSINFPTFFINNPVEYANLNKYFLSSALDFKNKLRAKGEEFWSIFASADLTSLERRLAFWVNGSVIYSPLFQEYFSMVPSRLGPEGAIRAVKYSWEPVACSAESSSIFEQEKKVQWADWTKDHTYAFPPHTPSAISKSHFPEDYLRKHVTERLASADFCFNLYVQLYRDSVSTSIEDSTDIWLRSNDEKKWWAETVVPGKIIWKTSTHNTETREDYLKRFNSKQISPPILAATLTMKQLTADSLGKVSGNNKTCEDLSFNPWNGDIAHHKPLGIVGRMKRKVYNASRRTRHELNNIDDKNIERR